jgi:hypothetical protein
MDSSPLITRWAVPCRVKWPCHAALFSGSEGKSDLRHGSRRAQNERWGTGNGPCSLVTEHGAVLLSRGTSPPLHLRPSLTLPHVESRGVLCTAQYYGAPCDTYNFRPEEHFQLEVAGWRSEYHCVLFLLSSPRVFWVLALMRQHRSHNFRPLVSYQLVRPSIDIKSYHDGRALIG